MNYTLDILPAAFRDLESAVRWIARNISYASAKRWKAKADAALILLCKQPTLREFAYEEQWLDIGLRQMWFGRNPHRYRILFTIDGTTLHIHRVRHAARDWLGDKRFVNGR